MEAIKYCYISRAISFSKYADRFRKTGKDPFEGLPFKSVHVKDNAILKMIIGNVPFAQFCPAFYLNNTWYQSRVIGVHGDIIRFAQYVVTSPYLGDMRIKSVRYVDIVLR